MSKRSLFKRVAKWASMIAVGGSAFQVSGCDPAVRDTLLAGLEATTGSLADTLISAFFISLEDNEAGSSDGLTTT